MEFSNQTLKQIGMAQRMICLFILIKIVTILVIGVLPIPKTIISIFDIVYAIILITNTWKLSAGLGYEQIFSIIFCICLFIPLVGIITLIALSLKASEVLKNAGLPVGIMGVPKEELDKL